MTNTLIPLAYALAKHFHAGQVYTLADGTKHDYFEYHVEGVANKFYRNSDDEHRYMLALLHDVLEDTQINQNTLQNLFGDRLAKDVRSLTRQVNYSYATYIRLLAKHGSPDAIAVKIADLEFNLSHCKEGESRYNKYKDALTVLRGVA